MQRRGKHTIILPVLFAFFVSQLAEHTHGYGLDCSFPIHNRTLRSECGTLGDRSSVYQEYMRGCASFYSKDECQLRESMRINLNRIQPQSMVNYTTTGYKKVKAPLSLKRLLAEFWENNKHDSEKEEWPIGDISTNHWSYPTKMIDVHDEEYAGGGGSLPEIIWKYAKSEIEQWTGHKVRPTSVYGIRIYERGSILSPHVDRLPLVSSCIVNVAQDVDEPWVLEVYDKQDQAVNITMEPFDMVFYESHSLMHGRPFPLNGDFYANIFIHFETFGESLDDSDQSMHNDTNLPPYIIPNSPSAKKFIEENPMGWSKVIGEKDYEIIHKFAQEGDIDEMKELLDKDPRLVNAPSSYDNWLPIHEAVFAGNVDMVNMLIERGADINAWTDDDLSPYCIALYQHGLQDEITQLLVANGADTTESELGYTHWSTYLHNDDDDDDDEVYDYGDDYEEDVLEEVGKEL